MNLYLSILVYLIMGALLSVAIVLAVKGTIWVLGVMAVLFIFAFGKIGCAHH